MSNSSDKLGQLLVEFFKIKGQYLPRIWFSPINAGKIKDDIQNSLLACGFGRAIGEAPGSKSLIVGYAPPINAVERSLDLIESTIMLIVDGFENKKVQRIEFCKDFPLYKDSFVAICGRLCVGCEPYSDYGRRDVLLLDLFGLKGEARLCFSYSEQFLGETDSMLVNLT